jgi:hypothetical protein
MEVTHTNDGRIRNQSRQTDCELQVFFHGTLAEAVGAATQLIKEPRISQRRSNGIALHSTSSYLGCRFAVANDLVAPAIVGAGAVGWSRATSEVGQELPT